MIRGEELQRIEGAAVLQNVKDMAGAVELQRVKVKQSCRSYSRDSRVAERRG